MLLILPRIVQVKTRFLAASFAFNLHRPRSMGYDMSLDWSFENEVIDDSEPEREELRRLTRRTLSRSPGKPDKGKARMVVVGDVSDIEIELGGERALSEEVIEISSE